MVSGARFTNCFFTANHASNYLPIRARLPREREKVLRLIDDSRPAGDASLLRRNQCGVCE
jgi:hypothetical protein